MTVRYQAYPEYKEANHWLGDVPTHWTVSKFAYVKNILTDYTANGSFADLKENVTYKDEPSFARLVRLTDLRRNLNNDGVWIDENAYNYLKKSALFGGEFLLANVGAYAGLFYQMPYDKGAASLAPNMFMAKFEKSKIVPEFMAYVGQSNPINKQLTLSATASSAQPKLNKDDFKSIRFTYPSLDEQQQIAYFLDHETTKIDTLIIKQEKLIELLKEKRKVVNSHAITCGLNSNAPMKDSGIEWLGEVPEHWELKKFKYIFKIRKRIAGEIGFDILSITQKGIKVKDISSGDGQLSMDYSKYQLVHKSDFAMNHMDLLTGFVDISKYDGVTSPDYRVFTLEHQQSSAEYYLNILQMGYLDKLFYPLGQGAAHIGRWRLPTEAFNEFVAPCPPKKEQEDITNFISTTFKKIDNLLEKATNAVLLMKERKTALITAAVTGKIDVRNYNADKAGN